MIDLSSKYNQNSKLIVILENFFRIKKCYGICYLYYSNKCFLYSVSLIKLELENLKKLQESLEQNSEELESLASQFDKDYKDASDVPMAQIYSHCKEQVQGMSKVYVILSKQSKIALYDTEQANMETMKNDLNAMELNQKFDQAETNNCLLDLVIQNRESHVDDKMEFIKVPPISKLIPTKPINLDLVGAFVDYPTIEYSKFKLKQEKKKGFFSSIFGVN